jgi:acetolactate synthase-1/2/3 large subunit
MSDNNKTTVGDAIAAFLEQCGVKVAFGVISIHNMPILDAIGRREKIRYVPARGEAGSVNMADASARVTGNIGVAFTSTGTAAGNAAGAMVEALTAGSPVLHITGQIETKYLDQDLAYIHEAPDQLSMLKAVSKAAFRVRSVDAALATVREAVRVALSAPAGPVSVEIPIDIQGAQIDWPEDLAPRLPDACTLDQGRVEQLANLLAGARRPLLWLGGGARGARAAVERLVRLGFGVVTSVQGRGILPEDHAMTLGAYNIQPGVEDFYRTCDAMLVVGSRLRGNETLKYQLKLPQPLYRIDADARADNRGYRNRLFVQGDAQATLNALADLLEGKIKVDASFASQLAEVKAKAVNEVADGLGPYQQLVSAVQKAVGRDYQWVRDVTISNSTWGNRALQVFEQRDGVHALGGGIGQGVQMGIGAALSRPERKAVCLVGDGGLQVNIGELATAVQEKANLTILLMNDGGYGVIRNIQDVQYGGRRYYVDLHQPDFGQHCASLKLPHTRVRDLKDMDAVLAQALAVDGPYLIEIDMLAIGGFATNFAGPPVRKEAAASSK